MKVRTAHPSDRDAIEVLLARREEADGHPAVSEHTAIRLLSHEKIGRVVVDGGNRAPSRLVGYAVASRHPAAAGVPHGHWTMEIVSEPGHPGEIAIVRMLVETAPDVIPDDAPLTLWVWRQAETAAVSTLGLGRVRMLAEMGRDLPTGIPWTLPEGVELRPFRHEDGAAWLNANNAAFAGHPENGALDADNLAKRLAQPWFDAEGFLLAWDGDRIAGFCWTKVHEDGRGEIYILAVVPEAQGRGLGKALLLAGLDDLNRRHNVSEAILYTDAEDGRAVGLYEATGFGTVRMLEELTLRR
jgi:mycothiol synthase